MSTLPPLLLPAAAMLGAIVLVGGQTILERVLHLATPLPVVIEIAGGGLFLAMVLSHVRLARRGAA